MSYNNYKSNEEPSKTEENNLNFKQLLAKLEEVKSKSNFRELTFLCQEMIDFLKQKETMIDSRIEIDKERPKFLYQISQKTMRLLTEAIYMENKQNQRLKIIKIYNWYFDKIKRNKDLKKITERTEKEWYQEEEEEPPKSEPVKIEEIKKHRCFIGGYESAKKRLLEYNTKKLNASSKVSQVTFGDENVNFYGKSIGYNTMANFKPINELNLPNYISTSQNSTKYGTFYNKGKAKPEINTGTDWFSKTGLDFKKEVKESYSYIRPPYEYEFLLLENKILQQKQKDLAEKRNLEGIEEAVEEYGFRKSFYKGAMNEKNEMKNMIKKYKELLEKKKIEEELRRQEEERKRKIEEDILRKELEKKREIAKSKIKEIKKPDPNRKKKKIIILGLNENKHPQENEQENNNVIDEKEEENDKEEENNVEEKELKDEKLEQDKKIDMSNIKYINKYKSEEQIKSENLNNNNKYNQVQSESEKVQFHEIKINKKGFKLKELAIDTQYNDLKAKQNELNESDNKPNQKVIIPSNLSSYLMFSDKIFYRRNLGRALNNFKEIDIPKIRYQESFSPLSFYDNKHKELRESPSKIDKRITLTENFAVKTFYNFKNNFLQMRKSLSAHKEKEFKNTLIYKNSKPKYRIKLDDMSIMPNDVNKFPIYYLPYKKEDELLAGPKNKKGDDKKKRKK